MSRCARGAGRRGTVPALLVIHVLAYLLVCGPAQAEGARAERVREVPVEFTVVNQNRSPVACPADGRSYTVRGHLVAPPRALARPDSVGLYVHGATLGEFNWRFKDVPGYDTMAELAALGHTSISIDRLGFDSSDHPVGKQMCLGSEADVVAQVIDDLKAGTYRVGKKRGPSFRRVALVGYSAGGAIAEIVGHSFGNADALGVVAWVDRLSPVHLRLAPDVATLCLTGGEPVEDDGTGPGGYAFSWPSWEDQHRDAFDNTEQAVLDAVGSRLNRDPCGYAESLSSAMLVNNVRLSLIDDPVLIVYADRDRIAPRPSVGAAEERIGSSDVTVATISDAGHTVMLQRSAPEFRSVLHRWLDAHGF